MFQFISVTVKNLCNRFRKSKSIRPDYAQKSSSSYPSAAVPKYAGLKDTGNRLARRSNKPRLMAVDPDPAVLNFISDIASPWYSVIGARDAGWAKAWLMQHKDIVACVTGEKLNSGISIDLLQKCQSAVPNMLRVLVTEQPDEKQNVDALMSGLAHRLVQAPVGRESLGVAIDPMQIRLQADRDTTVVISDRRKLLAA